MTSKYIYFFCVRNTSQSQQLRFDLHFPSFCLWTTDDSKHSGQQSWEQACEWEQPNQNRWQAHRGFCSPAVTGSNSSISATSDPPCWSSTAQATFPYNAAISLPYLPHSLGVHNGLWHKRRSPAPGCCRQTAQSGRDKVKVSIAEESRCAPELSVDPYKCFS